MKLKYILTLTLISLAGIISLAGYNLQNDPNTTPAETYAKVKIFISSPEDVMALQNRGIDMEHYTGNPKTGIEVVINYNEVERLKSSGLRYEIVINNMSEYYKNLPAPTELDMAPSRFIQQQDNVAGFGYGSMGGFHTYDQVVQQLDSLRLLYPNIVSSKINIGTTHQGRTIWAVKISDNPAVNESATEPVIFFDALHHAREPIGMSVILYYMYWLGENYATNPEASYLVNNREIYFVPVANPDGYVYNQTTNPNGGGFWRKNRRNNGGNAFGVDLNRNYPFGWGINSGSSNDPTDETYRGPSAGSEPETQAIMTLANSIHPKIGFSLHSVAGRYLNPYSYNDSAVSYSTYSDFTSDFGPSTGYLYGTVIEMLDYYSSGTTRDFMHSIGSHCWTPEIGGSGFWPLQSEIVPLVSNNLFSMKYLTWAGGAYPKLQNFSILGPGYVQKNDTLQLQLSIRNKGLSQTSKNVVVELSTSYPNVVALTSSVNYDSIQSRQQKFNATPFKFRLTSAANVTDEIKFICVVKQEGVIASQDTFRVNVGKIDMLYTDNAESGTTNWTKSGTGTQWDTTFVSSWSGNKSFADSRYGNSQNSTNNYFTMNLPVNLAGTVNPRIEFAAKWATELNFDYARLQISTNNGTSWLNLGGRFTRLVSGQPSYNNLSYWVYEQVSLTPYIGSTIKVRFNYVADNGLPGDGFYFDNFRIVDYKDQASSITSLGGELPKSYSLYQNYPNPFNPVTKIKFDIPKNDIVKITVFDVTGRETAKIFSGQVNAGRYEVSWDASAFTSGVYFYKISSSSFSSVKKMLLVK